MVHIMLLKDRLQFDDILLAEQYQWLRVFFISKVFLMVTSLILSIIKFFNNVCISKLILLSTRE